MRARTYTAVLEDDDHVVAIDASVGPGMPGLALSHGAGFDGIEQLATRLRIALARCGHVLQPRARRLALGIAGASPGIDLAAVCAVLAGHEIVPSEALVNTLLWGTLDGDGSLRPTPGARRVADLARAAGFRRLFVSAASASEIGDAPGLTVLPVAHVADLVTNLRDELALGFGESSRLTLPLVPGDLDMVDLHGLARVRGAIEIMLAGRHGALVRMTGRESRMLLRRLPGLIPEPDETLAAERLALGKVGADPRAFVQVLDPAIASEQLLGSHPARPGPACLAHGGVLVLDDLHRHSASMLDAIRRASRGDSQGPRPAKFAVLATTRPKDRRPKLLSRPRVLAECVAVVAESDPDERERSSDRTEIVRARISTARARQHQRFRGRWLDLAWTCNAEIPGHPNVLDEFCPTSESGRALLDDLANHQRWTRDQRNAVLRVARTVADLDPDRDPSAPLDRECMATAAMFQPRP
jgi:predicted ATPase with chaperone activity